MWSRFLPKRISLGRWDLTQTTKQKDLKAILANIDHCGDKICGLPIKNNAIIKKELMDKKINQS